MDESRGASRWRVGAGRGTMTVGVHSECSRGRAQHNSYPSIHPSINPSILFGIFTERHKLKKRGGKVKGGKGRERQGGRRVKRSKQRGLGAVCTFTGCMGKKSIDTYDKVLRYGECQGVELKKRDQNGNENDTNRRRIVT